MPYDAVRLLRAIICTLGRCTDATELADNDLLVLLSRLRVRRATILLREILVTRRLRIAYAHGPFMTTQAAIAARADRSVNRRLQLPISGRSSERDRVRGRFD